MRTVIFFWFLLVAGISTAQPLYRKGPLFETFISDSLFTSDYFNSSKDGFTPIVRPVALVGWNKQEKEPLYHLQLLGGVGYRSKKIRSELYVNSIRSSDFNVNSTYRETDLQPGFIFQAIPDEHITLTAGYDRNFIGEGYRSVFLGDHVKNYPFLRMNAAFWKVNYTVMFAYLKNTPDMQRNTVQSNKYAAMHMVELKPWAWLDLQVFENVIWQAKDSLYNRGFDINYLNPFVFYRPVEFSAGSTDNAQVGAAVNIRPVQNLVLYSQLLLDEFLLSEVKARRGWWGNKYAVQCGAKAYDLFGLKGLSILGEISLARPFTWSHATPLTSYTHDGQPLAHQLGANFYEGTGIMQYKRNRNRFTVMLTSFVKGYSWNTNVGEDPSESYITRAKDYGNTIAQGERDRVSDIRLSYGRNILKDKGLELVAGVNLQQFERHCSVLMMIGIRTPVFNLYPYY